MITAISIPCYNRPHYLKDVMAGTLVVAQVRLGTPVDGVCSFGGEDYM